MSVVEKARISMAILILKRMGILDFGVAGAILLI